MAGFIGEITLTLATRVICVKVNDRNYAAKQGTVKSTAA